MKAVEDIWFLSKDGEGPYPAGAEGQRRVFIGRFDPEFPPSC